MSTSTLIHARLDKATAALCRQIGRRLGWSDSRIVREGIKALSMFVATSKKRRIVGQGKYRSGVRDLGSNKKHLEGFGR